MTATRMLLLLAAFPLIFSACQVETGINNRHIQGIVTLPPLPLWEQEVIPRDFDDEATLRRENNDERAFAEGPFTVKQGYHIIRGWSEDLCSELDLESAEASQAPDCEPPFITALGPDEDFYRVRVDYRGPVLFRARLVGEDLPNTVDVDMEITLLDGTEVYTDPNRPAEELDEDGNPILDEEGNPVPHFPLPLKAHQSEGGTEFMIRVAVSGPAEYDGTGYELEIVGEDPRQHFQNSGIEGNNVQFDGDPEDPIPVDPLEIKVGAFLNNNIEELGNPVGGTGCKTWELDEETDTFFCAFDVALVQEVSVESNVLIEGMGDGRDNDCNGIADTGTEEVDNDGDGVTIADGDCDDTNAEIHPNRGDRFGDRLDNDCDGWADNGPDDVDDDGDGFCESGRDLDGDGVCRGAGERGGFAGGDCNDVDASIYPGLDGVEIEHNNIDDDCDGYDARLEIGRNTDGAPGELTLQWYQLQGCTDGSPDADNATQGWVAWGDVEEIACGSDEFNPCEKPVDADNDGLCDSDCLGTVGCAQDNDGDGVHNWDEMLCNSDPDDAASLPADLDEDGICNGKDLDADGDGFLNKDRAVDGSDDCNDMDPLIRPHGTDLESGEITLYWYDVPNSIDDDCDGVVDENRDWERGADLTFTNNVSYDQTDEDGDGYPLGLRDCNDNDPDIRPGNYEVRSANVVQSDFNTVWLFAGDVTSLNSTRPQPAARRVDTLVPFDIAKDRVSWELVADWEENVPPLLTASNLPVLVASDAEQPEVGQTWFEDEDADANGEGLNNAPIIGFGAERPPWENFQELGFSAGAGKTNELFGSITDIVTNTWDGDNDAYHVTFPSGGFLNATLDWTAANTDYDALFYCYYFDTVNAPAIYRIPLRNEETSQYALASGAKPEQGETIVPLPRESDCWITIIGYSGGAGGYTMTLTPQGFGDEEEEEEEE